MSPPVPPEWVTAAARALHADRCVSESCRESGHAADQLLASVHMTGDQSADLHIASVALEAAAPLMGPWPLASADVLRDAVALLHMAGIKTGAQFEHLVSGVITTIYATGRDHA